jgi:hypothetical protein
MTVGDKEDQQLCAFYETLEAISEDNTSSMPLGVYTLDDLRAFGQKKTFCPYFLARRMVGILFYSENKEKLLIQGNIASTC